MIVKVNDISTIEEETTELLSGESVALVHNMEIEFTVITQGQLELKGRIEVQREDIEHDTITQIENKIREVIINSIKESRR